MTSTTIYHYVYRITNLVENKHYYGKRTSRVEPKLDLGTKYFSSSKNKQFKQDQLDNPRHYKYKIVGIYKTPEQAIVKEQLLHDLFEVGKNPNFYNAAKQSGNGFDTTGFAMMKDPSGKFYRVPVGSELIKTLGLKGVYTGSKASRESRLKRSKASSGKVWITNDEYTLFVYRENLKDYPGYRSGRTGIPKKPKKYVVRVSRLFDRKLMDIGNFTQWVRKVSF